MGTIRRGLFDTVLNGTCAFLGQAWAFKDGQYVRIATTTPLTLTQGRQSRWPRGPAARLRASPRAAGGRAAGDDQQPGPQQLGHGHLRPWGAVRGWLATAPARFSRSATCSPSTRNVRCGAEPCTGRSCSSRGCTWPTDLPDQVLELFKIN